MVYRCLSFMYVRCNIIIQHSKTIDTPFVDRLGWCFRACCPSIDNWPKTLKTEDSQDSRAPAAPWCASQESQQYLFNLVGLPLVCYCCLMILSWSRCGSSALANHHCWRSCFGSPICSLKRPCFPGMGNRLEDVGGLKMLEPFNFWSECYHL